MYSIRIKKLLILLPFLFPFFVLFSQEQQVQLDWERVNGAEEYKVIIQQEDGDDLYEIMVQNPPLNVSLFQGKYRFMIQVYNKFGQFISETPWESLEVRQAQIPELGEAELDLWYSDHGGFTTTIKARGIEPNAVFSLVHEDRILKLEGESLGNDRYRIQLHEDIPVDGEWFFSVQNPSGLKTVSSRSLKIEPYLIPVIDDFSRKTFSMNEIFPILEISGTGFNDSTRVIFRSDSLEQKSPSVDVINGNMLKITLDTQNMPIGPYHVLVQNANGEADEYPYAINIERSEGEESSTIPNSGRQKHSLSVSAGMALGVPLANTSKELSLSSPGYSIRLEAMVNNGLKKNSTADNPISIALTLTDINYQFKDNQAIMLKDQSLTFDISYLMVHRSPIRPGLLVGGGLGLSHLLNTDLSLSTSLDFHYMAGGFIHIDNGTNFFFRHSLLYKQNLYVYENSHHFINVIYIGIWIK